MAIWPELRASYRNETGLELANASMDVFVEHVLWYSVIAPDGSHQRREALLKAVYGESVEGVEFEVQARSLEDELAAMNAHLNQGV